MDETYNGYTNYETWVCALWLSSDESTQREAYRIAHNQSITGVQKDDAFRSWIEALRPDADAEASLYTDLLTNAISRINWTEVTKCFEDE